MPTTYVFIPVSSGYGHPDRPLPEQRQIPLGHSPLPDSGPCGETDKRASKTTKKSRNKQGTQEGDGYDEADHPGHIPASALAALAFIPVLVHRAPS